MSKQVELKCIAEEKTFTNKETGESVNYISLTVFIDNQPIKVSVSSQSKQLFNYLFEKNFSK